MTGNQVIPDAAVEAAAKVMHEHKDIETTFGEVARAALEAAAPFIAEQALEEAARDLSWLGAQGNLAYPDTAWAGITACMNTLRARAAAARAEAK